MKTYHILLRFAAVSLLLLPFPTASGQKVSGKLPRQHVTLEIVDGQGQRVPYAEVMSSKNRHVYYGDAHGVVKADLRSDDMIKIEAAGYLPLTVPFAEVAGKPVVIEKVPLYTDRQSSFNTLFGRTNARRTVGAYSKVDGKDLVSTPTTYLMNALGGRLNGLFTWDSSNIPGIDGSNSFVRANFGGMTIMVDGVERSLTYIEPETVESVTLLKDASLKSLYGGVHTNGILMVKTKRGVPYENSTRINVQTGIQRPTRLPKFLNAYDYTTMFNQALINSGQSPIYDPSVYLDPNRDEVLYPDVDYYGMFLNDHMTLTKASGQFTGGTENTRYFLHFGYTTNGGLEKFTQYPNKDEVMTLRGNVDNTIFGFITLNAGFNAALENKMVPTVAANDFINALSGNRANEFPIFIPGRRVGQPDKEFVLGGTSTNSNNPYGLLARQGYVSRDFTFIQSDFSLNIDLDRWIKGLSVKPSVVFDVYNLINSSQGGTFAVFEPVSNAATGEVSFLNYGNDWSATSKSLSGNATQRQYVFNTTVNYDRRFGRHDLNALLTYFMSSKEFSDYHQRMRRLNIGGLVNYMYDNRYIGEVSLNCVGSASFAPSERYGVFPTFGAGWILSEESFMKPLSAVDYLKVRASYGVLGSTSYNDDGLATYYYRDKWISDGSYGVSGYSNRARPSETGNPDLGYQKSYEFNVGVDFLLFDKSFSGSIGYFHNKLTGGFGNMADITPGVLGGGAALMTRNFKEYVVQGWEGELSYTKRFGDWNILIGGNVSHGYAEVTKELDSYYPVGYEGLAKVRRLGDVKGLQVIGTFADQADIDNSPFQQYGKILPGDFKYLDANGDGVVNDQDARVIANQNPSWQYGVTLSVEWKSFNLDVLCYGLAGFERVLSGKYYRMYGTRKYSNVLKTGLPNGNPHPILRAEYSNNNFTDSDYWVVDGSFFKLRNVELGYTLPYDVTRRMGINNLKVFARGFNLLTISKITDLDPENLDAGVGTYPLCTTITGGVSFSF